MTAITTAVVCVVSLTWEASSWRTPSATTLGAIVYNAVLIFASATPPGSFWRDRCRVASSISICLIPVLGLLSGALLLGEILHWQTAWPSRSSCSPSGPCCCPRARCDKAARAQGKVPAR